MHPLRHRAPTPPSWTSGGRAPRILVEAAEPLTAWAYEDLLRRTGFDVLTCRGPYARGDCPLLHGDPCPAAEDASGIVFALDITDPHEHEVLAAHRRAHPEVPICVEIPTAKVTDADVAGAAARVRSTAPSPQVVRTIRRMLRRTGRLPGIEWISGRPGAPGTGRGRVRIVESSSVRDLTEGEVIVVHDVHSSIVPALVFAAALVVEAPDAGTAAIFGRELDIPVVVAAEGACTRLRDEEIVTVDGDTGRVYIEPARPKS